MMHDLRSPIKNIKVLTDMMRADYPENEWLDMIDQCGVQASEIFEDFLDFIKETPVKKLPLILVLNYRRRYQPGRKEIANGVVIVNTKIADRPRCCWR